jgi:hypothetical protein
LERQDIHNVYDVTCLLEAESFKARLRLCIYQDVAVTGLIAPDALAGIVRCLQRRLHNRGAVGLRRH